MTIEQATIQAATKLIKAGTGFTLRFLPDITVSDEDDYVLGRGYVIETDEGEDLEFLTIEPR